MATDATSSCLQRLHRRSPVPSAVAAAVALIVLLTAPGPAQAAQNEQSTCGNTRNDFGVADSLYDAINDNGEGRVGARRLVVDQSGKIVSRGRRLFVQATPLDVGRVRISLEKLAGRGRTTVAICTTTEGEAARQQVRREFVVPRGTGSFSFTRTLGGVRDKRVSVLLKGKSLTDTMRYRLKLQRPNAGDVWEPNPGQLAASTEPVTGFADVHVHHAARHAFGAGWYAGEMEGPFVEPEGHLEVLSIPVPGSPPAVVRAGHDGSGIPAWNDTSHNQLGFDALRSAHANGLRLIVSSAVNSQWLCAGLAAAGQTDRQLPCNDMESAKFQIRAMKQFDARHDWYRIVTNPWEAREAIEEGKLAVILGVEISNLFPSSDGSWRRQLDELYAMGVRQIYLAHESNNRFAGAAFHHTQTLKYPNQLTAAFSDEIQYASEQDGVNPIGLTVKGRALVREMMDRNMLIDIDHISWRAVDQAAAISRNERHYPLYAGHTRANELLTPEHREVVQELNTPPNVVEYIRRSGGIVGLRTGPDRIESASAAGPQDTCGGSVTSLIQNLRYFSDRGIPVAFGTDLNGFVPMTAPRLGPDACPDAPEGRRLAQRLAQQAPPAEGLPSSWPLYATRGLADISTLPSVLHDMRFLGADTTNIEGSAEAVLRMWTRTYQDGSRSMIGAQPASGR